MPEEVAEAPETETNMANTLCYERVNFFCTVDSRSRNVTHKAFLKRFLSKREGMKEKTQKNYVFEAHTHRHRQCICHFRDKIAQSKIEQK